MEKRDATWKNIKDVLSGIEDEIQAADSFANDAQHAADNAFDQITKLKKLLKIREEYDGQEIDPWFNKTELANEVIKLIEDKIKGRKSSD